MVAVSVCARVAATIIMGAMIEVELQAFFRDFLHEAFFSRRREIMSRWLIIFGVILIAVGLLWPAIAKLGLGRLPGDIVIERGNFRLYIPLVTSLIVSAALSLIFWLLNR